MPGAAAASPPGRPDLAVGAPWVVLPPPPEALARLRAAVVGVWTGPLVASSAEVVEPRSGRRGDQQEAAQAAAPGGSHGPRREVEAEHREVWALVERARTGDGEAFGRLYDRYVDVVYRYVFYRVGDRTLAEDLTSETFLRALRRISSVTYQGRDIGAWLVTIARNLILDHVKSARSRLESTTDDIGAVGDLAGAAGDLPGASRPATPEALVLDALTSTRLMQAVGELNPEQRECVLLRFVHGFSVGETAEVMGKNDGAIKALQHRAVRKLAGKVADLR